MKRSWSRREGGFGGPLGLLVGIDDKAGQTEGEHERSEHDGSDGSQRVMPGRGTLRRARMRGGRGGSFWR
jgi:hypothetical protein